MNAPSWDRIKEIFQEALARPAPERAVWLRERCGDDRGLQAEIESLLATQRIGDVWMAVRGRPSSRRTTDIRYDAGLVALKRRLADGSWVDLITRRPHYPLTGQDSAGPVLRRSNGSIVAVLAIK